MFKVQVKDIFRMAGRGMVLAGRVEEGQVWIGSRAQLRTPSATVITVITGLERNRQIVEQASLGEDVGILIKDIDPATLGDGVEMVETADGLRSWRVLNLLIEEAPKRWWKFWR